MGHEPASSERTLGRFARVAVAACPVGWLLIAARYTFATSQGHYGMEQVPGSGNLIAFRAMVLVPLVLLFVGGYAFDYSGKDRKAQSPVMCRLLVRVIVALMVLYVVAHVMWRPEWRSED